MNFETILQNFGLNLIIAKIFSNLDYQDLSNCKLVCKQWHVFINENVSIWNSQLERLENGKLIIRKKKFKGLLRPCNQRFILSRNQNVEVQIPFSEWPWCNVINHMKAKVLHEKILFVGYVFKHLNQLTRKDIEMEQSDSQGIVIKWNPIFHAILNEHEKFTNLFITDMTIEIDGHISHTKDFNLVQLIVNHGKLLMKHSESKNCKKNQLRKYIADELKYACENGFTEIVKILLQFPLDINEVECQTHGDGMSNLHRACANGHAKVVKVLIKHPDININLREEIANQETPLHIACRYGRFDVVFTLLDQPNLERNPRNIHGNTPLHTICDQFETRDTFLLLWELIIRGLTPGIDVNARNDNGETPFFVACKNGHLGYVKIMLWPLVKSIHINTPDKDGITPIKVAYQRGHFGVVKYLCKNPKIQINERDENGKTLLHYAVEEGQMEIVKSLFKHPHILLNIRDNSRRSPLDIAKDKGTINLYELFLENRRNGTILNKIVNKIRIR